jgi:lysozyme family protein
MVAENFARALKLVLVDEGGLDDDPHDHGGRTAYGIIQREYDGYRARHNLPPQDVWKITPAEYTEIYRDRYWSPWCDRLPAGMDYAFFDACVNTGPAQAAKNLQQAIGVRVDGFMGDVTLARVMALSADAAGAEAALHAFCARRRAFYRALRQFPRYGRGWLARVDHVEKAAKALVTNTATPQRNGLHDELKAQATAKARAEDTTAPPLAPATGAATTTGSVVAAGIAEQLGNASQQLSPFQDTIAIVKYALLAIAVVTIMLTIYGLAHDGKVKAATG